MIKESNLLIKNLQNMPIWIKQVIVEEFSQDIRQKMNDFLELVQADNLFQYLAPKLTTKGKIDLEERSSGLSEGYYTFMKELDEETTIFDITIKNNWTLADSAKIFTRLDELEYVAVKNQQNNTNIALAAFLASKIKTGEFLKKIGKIDANQLEQALRYQKQLNDEGRHIKMASILIKMGFITDKGLDSLLMLKEESKKHAPVGLGYTTNQFENEDDKNDQIVRLQKEIARLEKENLIMKKRLKKLLNME